MTCAHCRREELLVSSCGHGGLCATCAALVEVLEEEARRDDE